MPPQSTKMEHKRRFLAFTLEGFITCRAEGPFNAIEIEFADVHTNRPVRFSDYSGFTMAAMGSSAAVFASPGDGRAASAGGEAGSVVHYRPFSSWAPNADWTLSLPVGEQAPPAPPFTSRKPPLSPEAVQEPSRVFMHGRKSVLEGCSRSRGRASGRPYNPHRPSLLSPPSLCRVFRADSGSQALRM